MVEGHWAPLFHMVVLFSRVIFGCLTRFCCENCLICQVFMYIIFQSAILSMIRKLNVSTIYESLDQRCPLFKHIG